MSKKTVLQKGRNDILVAVLLVLFLFVGGGFINVSGKHMIMKISIMALLALSLNIQTGLGGLRPLGHALMFGLGAYTYAVGTVRWNLNPYIAVVTGIGITLLITLLLGFLLVRKSDDLAFSFLSMGFCTLVYTMVLKSAYLGFDSGINNVPRLPFAQSDTAFYYFSITVVCILALLIYFFSKSPFSWIFRACRENKQKANCIGIDIVKVQLMGYVISGMFACLAGMLYAMKNSGAYTSSIAVQLSMETLIMCLLGGMNNFWGPVLGALVVVTFNTQVNQMTIYSNFFLGLLTLFVVMFMQGGILDAEMQDKIRRVLIRSKRKDKGQA